MITIPATVECKVCGATTAVEIEAHFVVAPNGTTLLVVEPNTLTGDPVDLPDGWRYDTSTGLGDTKYICPKHSLY